MLQNARYNNIKNNSDSASVYIIHIYIILHQSIRLSKYKVHNINIKTIQIYAICIYILIGSSPLIAMCTVE